MLLNLENGEIRYLYDNIIFDSGVPRPRLGWKDGSKMALSLA
ncbi:MAG: hypothetical protein R2873_22475 [Caldilineaceae bacterium]